MEKLPKTISIALASPEQIRSWSFGEILRPETINYRTGRSERGGLFDERVFGPERDYQCYCGKYRGVRYRGITCEKCGVDITRSIVRRERMGHIELASPVAHIWFLRGVPSRMGLLLDVSVSDLEKVVYFAGYIVMSVNEDERKRALQGLESEFRSKAKLLDETSEAYAELQQRYIETKNEIAALKKYGVLNETQYYTYSIKYSTLFEASIGAEALYELFKQLDLHAIADELTLELGKKQTAQNRERILKRLSVVRQMARAHLRPEMVFIKVIPVIPPALRPMVALDGGRFATSDVNDLYRRVINRNNRLKKLLEIGAPDVILRNEKRILQEAVDSLLDNSMKKTTSGAMSVGAARPLKSLADQLKGKQGIFRQNLLGKRVDYSGRSVIVVGPNLKLNQCGLPKYMALELFRPFVIGELMKRELAFNVRGANRLIDEGSPEVWGILEYVIQGKYVLLNRAPTLHRLSIQAFMPLLIEGKAIQVHPLVCSAFNADFDGDQMAVHLPLSMEAQREAQLLISADKNLLKPQTGTPITVPVLDIILGIFWMTKIVPEDLGEGQTFGSLDNLLLALEFGVITYRSKVHLVTPQSAKFKHVSESIFETTPGRLLFNQILPDDYPFVNKEIKKGDIEQIIQDMIEQYGVDIASRILDEIKSFGYRYSTISGTTFGMDELRIPDGRNEVIADTEAKVIEINQQFADGLISDQERYRMTVEVWESATSQIQKLLEDQLYLRPSIYDIIKSKAKGNLSQMNQAAGIKGVIQNAVGQVLDFPIKTCLKEGHSALEYFMNATTARKGLADTALNTQKAGYLTRRLHDVAQDVTVIAEDCGTKRFIVVSHDVVDGIDRPIMDQIYGRVLAEPIKDTSGLVVYKKGVLVTRTIAKHIQSMGVESVSVRSPLVCECSYGLCQQCYGLDMGRNHLVRVGEAVGTVASQAIGEPGTQLTLRTFHSGGVVGRDITQGLPRVEELFERRKPKAQAVIAHEGGVVTAIEERDGVRVIDVVSETSGRSAKGSKTTTYTIPFRRIATVKIGDSVAVGDPLTDGSIDPSELFEVAGRERAQDYLISEIAKVYELQSAPISRKHLEIIVRQMFSRCRVADPGDTVLPPGTIVTRVDVDDENAAARDRNQQEAVFEQLLLGISEAALQSPSWLSAASFQHTQKVLTGAATRGAEDIMRGLKENITIGNLIPAGTGINKNYIDMHDLMVDEEDVSLVDDSQNI